MLKKPKNLLIIGCVGMLISFAFMARMISRQIALTTGSTSPRFNEETLGPIFYSGLLAMGIGMFATIALIAAAVIYLSEKKREAHALGKSGNDAFERGPVS